MRLGFRRLVAEVKGPDGEWVRVGGWYATWLWPKNPDEQGVLRILIGATPDQVTDVRPAGSIGEDTVDRYKQGGHVTEWAFAPGEWRRVWIGPSE